MIGVFLSITRAEVEELLAHVTLKNAMIPMHLAVVASSEPGRLSVIIDRAVVKRDAPEPTMEHTGTVRSEHELPWTVGAVVSTSDVILWLRNRALREVMLHELDEWLHVDGVRVFDPHADD